MLGAIAGDLLGSPYEAMSTKDKGCRLFHELGRPTDDSVLSVAVADAILGADGAPGPADYAAALRRWGRRYPDAGYGGEFRAWMNDARRGPYHSWGNGSAMRTSAIGWAFDSVDEVLRQAALSAAPTHDHPEGVKGAQATALAVFMARNGAGKEDIRGELAGRFGYDLSRTIDGIRDGYAFDFSCLGSVPEALLAFLDSVDFVDAMRNAISLGGDSDTQASIAGAVAEAFYGGVPAQVSAWVLPHVEAGLLDTLSRFAERYLPERAARAVRDEIAARALPRGGRAAPRPGTRAPRSTRHPIPAYRVLLPADAWRRVEEHASRVEADPAIAGPRLGRRLAELPVPRADAAWLLSALLNTKRPRIFAESEVRGDGSDWTPFELGILGDLGVAIPVTVFDDGRHGVDARRHTGHGAGPAPWPGTLLFIPGALLTSADGRAVDAEVVAGGEIDQARYEALYERRLVPLLKYASTSAAAAGRQALVTVPGLGCGQFAGRWRGTLGARLRDALASILERHAPGLAGIRAVRFDPYDECENERREFGSLSFITRPLAVNERAGTGLGLPQLCPPRAYEEEGDDFSRCDLYSVVAWDHASWPGNDFWAMARATDDGVKAAATDAMFALTGFRGRYDADAAAYLPPDGVESWERLALDHRLGLRAIDNVMVVGVTG